MNKYIVRFKDTKAIYHNPTHSRLKLNIICNSLEYKTLKKFEVADVMRDRLVFIDLLEFVTVPYTDDE